MIQGLIGGIQSMAGRAASAAANVVGNAISAAKHALGIASPSRVFMEIGQNTIAGYVVALQSGKSTVQDAVTGAFTSKVPTLATGPALNPGLYGTSGRNGGTVVIQNQIGGRNVGEMVLDLATMQLRQSGQNRLSR